MSDRAYTVREIDELRNACDTLWMWGPEGFKFREGMRVGRSYKLDEKTKCVEEMVRTYMTAGVTADDMWKEYGE